MTNSENSNERIDEVEKHYRPVANAEFVCGLLFWAIAALSLFLPYANDQLGELRGGIVQATYICLVVLHFVLSAFSSLYLAPRAERVRRKQMISDSFGSAIAVETTEQYYNNSFAPSLQRLGANTMENALFSSRVAGEMLFWHRIRIVAYVLIWLFVFAWRKSNVETLMWITQLVFSADIIAGWMKLELLRNRHERVFEQLQTHFLHKLGDDSQDAIATVVNSFTEYESAKASSGLLLSSKIFHRLNPELTEEWKSIRSKLGMESS